MAEEEAEAVAEVAEEAEVEAEEEEEEVHPVDNLPQHQAHLTTEEG